VGGFFFLRNCRCGLFFGVSAKKRHLDICFWDLVDEGAKMFLQNRGGSGCFGIVNFKGESMGEEQE
jgi:hypothetical protein